MKRCVCKRHERLPMKLPDARTLARGFAICTGRIPNELHGSKAPTQWTCGVHKRLPGGFARCGAFYPAGCKVHCIPEKVHAN
ncbi:hypothetical protein CDL15_Pgr008302 [Punica granatum]|uniref:Uncharacterized protein n=1 Tax=Punica granatum TaxID=22663 RepID=A0A218W3A6_PUNGR|nr:hypothetical protein CDL15_Pgr008302 [Punica granatum]